MMIKPKPARGTPQRHPAQVALLWSVNTTWTDDERAEVAADNQFLSACLESQGYRTRTVYLYDRVDEVLPAGNRAQDWLIFNWCDGYADRPSDPFEVVADLERLGYFVTGPDSRTLRLSRDKGAIRRILYGHDIPIPPGRRVESSAHISWQHYPAIVKPANQHASIGITRESVVENECQLIRQVEWALEMFQAPVLIEEYIEGREFLVTVWGNRTPEVLPPVELDYAAFEDIHNQIYHYDAKFGPDATPGGPEIDYLCPAIVDAPTWQLLQSVCLTAYRATRCRDFARMDIRLHAGIPYVLDVNPNPDIYCGS